ncbi:MAG: protein kinase [Deltaproteobacteria bacterium]|nr:protein kinase [Deltaproteobacteria bacterium]
MSKPVPLDPPVSDVPGVGPTPHAASLRVVPGVPETLREGASAPRRTCPTCGRQYEPPARFCQVDGITLKIEETAPDPYLGTRIVDQFLLERVLGAGGMGVVYDARDNLSRRWAVKILHRDLITNKDIVLRFQQEAQIASRLDHPGIVRVHQFGQLRDGNLYLVLEFLEGPTLAEAMDAQGPFATARAVNVVARVADAIGYAHAQKIVHRDLKPENIILTSADGDPEFPKVLDFGIAKMLLGSGSFVTQAGLIFGTARYISPEGAAGEPVDQRGDVYSLGVIAYQLLAGHTPFEADEPVQLLIKHMHQPVPPLRTWPAAAGVPAELEAVINRALVKNPEGRFPDAQAFAAALREAVPSAPRAAEVRSLVPTTVMPASEVAGVAGVAGVAELARTVATAAVADAPVGGVATRDPSVSGVSRVRVQIHPANGVPISTLDRGSRVDEGASTPPSAIPAAPLLGPGTAPPSAPRATAPSSGPPETSASLGATAVRLHPRMELPVIPPTQLSAPSALEVPQPFAPSEDSGELVVPGLPRRRSQAQGTSFVTTLATVGVSMVLAFAIALGGAWAFRMFPSQRRADELQGLLSRASAALADGHYVHARDGADVEDLTDAVLALDPENARAHALRQAAAARLRAAADAARLNNRPAEALPHLQNALRLVEDHALREELAVLERQAHESSRPRPHLVAPPARPPAPAPPPPRRPPAPPLVHPPQPAVPLHPPTPAQGAQSAQPAQPTQPSVTRPLGTTPESAPGQVLQSPPLVPPVLYNPAFGRPAGRTGMF